MTLSPIKKVLLILVLTAGALFISLPSFQINLSLGNFFFERRGDLTLGLDLAGGSHLVFEAATSSLSRDKKEAALLGLKEVIERRVNLFGVSEPTVALSQFEGRDRVIVEIPGISNSKEAVDLVGKTAQLSFAQAPDEEGKELIPTNLTGADLTSAKVAFDQNTGKPAVSIEFTKEGADKFSEITEKNVGKRLAILLDGNVISAPVVNEKISGGNALITGQFTLDEARRLSVQLSAGALPLSVSLVEERTVGATLGKEAIEKSIKGGLVGIAGVALFMILTYGRLGAVSSFSLFVFAVLSLAIYKLVPIVITLPGIAGFLLSVGMAVDSNILIFERFKEERVNRAIADALEVSFGRAWDAIRDANIATLLTAFILANPFDWQFLNTSGPVRGFALTLALGVLISLFTGIVVSRNLLRVFIGENAK